MARQFNILRGDFKGQIAEIWREIASRIVLVLPFDSLAEIPEALSQAASDLGNLSRAEYHQEHHQQ
jgi:hypothetical protein